MLVLTHLNTLKISLTIAILTAVQRHRIKIEIVRSLDNRCSTSKTLREIIVKFCIANI